MWHLDINVTFQNKTDGCHRENVLIAILVLFILFYRLDVRPLFFTVVLCLFHVPVIYACPSFSKLFLFALTFSWSFPAHFARKRSRWH